MWDELDVLTLQMIMTRWPRTMRVFIDWRLHCIGCPIADFHRIADSAREHGYTQAELKSAIRNAINAGGASPRGPAVRHRRSAAGDAGP